MHAMSRASRCEARLLRALQGNKMHDSMNLHCSNLETVLDWSGISGGVGIMKIWEGAMHPTVGDSHPLCKVHAMRTKGEGRTGRDNKMDVYPATPPAPPRFGNTTAQAPSETLTHLQRWTTMVLATAYKSRMGHFLFVWAGMMCLMALK